MTKFVGKELDENVNVSPVSENREFLVLFSGLIAIMVVGYFFLGIILNVMIDRMPDRVDQALSGLFQFKDLETPEELQEVRQEMQQLLDDLVAFLPETDAGYEVHVVDHDDVNALAFPGKKIILFSGLLKEVESENELATILAHELGHFQNRDHLKGLGRGVVFVIISSILVGNNSGITDFVSGALSLSELKFSREQEEAADQFALRLIYQKYGHVGGATHFFERMREKEGLLSDLGFISTHPASSKRVDLMNQLTLHWNYPIKELKPLNKVILEFLTRKSSE